MTLYAKLTLCLQLAGGCTSYHASSRDRISVEYEFPEHVLVKNHSRVSRGTLYGGLIATVGDNPKALQYARSARTYAVLSVLSLVSTAACVSAYAYVVSEEMDGARPIGLSCGSLGLATFSLYLMGEVRMFDAINAYNDGEDRDSITGGSHNDDLSDE